jgi:hypothetical protein
MKIAALRDAIAAAQQDRTNSDAALDRLGRKDLEAAQGNKVLGDHRDRLGLEGLRDRLDRKGLEGLRDRLDRLGQ